MGHSILLDRGSRTYEFEVNEKCYAASYLSTKNISFVYAFILI